MARSTSWEGPLTIQAFVALGALEQLEIVALPILLGDLPLSPGHPSPISAAQIRSATSPTARLSSPTPSIA
jgi:hypothetical protein